MFPSKALLSLIFITLSVVDASPLDRRSGKTTLSFATRINARGVQNIAEKDRARAQALKQGLNLGKRSASFSVTNAAITYTAEIGVGNPQTNYTLIIDTGSSSTWVGANKLYTPTTTSSDTGNKFSQGYGSGYVTGEEWTDQVTLSPDLVITKQSIGVANQSQGIAPFDGILGVGPVDLTVDTVSNTATVPTVSDNLFSDGTISKEVLGVYFVPASEPNSIGELTFGGHDSSVITSSVAYVPLTTTSPSSKYWGIDQRITYGSETILSTTSGIVDTGTSLILIPSDAFQGYWSVTGAALDQNTGLLVITAEQYANLKTLTFHIGSKSYDLTPNAQIWPRSLNAAIGGNADSIYLVVNDIGSLSGSGLDFIDGYSFLERHYSVFDTTNKRVGFANTAYTNSESN